MFTLTLIILAFLFIFLPIIYFDSIDKNKTNDVKVISSTVTITKLIEQLERFKVEHGDIPCAVECSGDTLSGPIDSISVKKASNGVKAVYLSCND